MFLRLFYGQKGEWIGEEEERERERRMEDGRMERKEGNVSETIS